MISGKWVRILVKLARSCKSNSFNWIVIFIILLSLLIIFVSALISSKTEGFVHDGRADLLHLHLNRNEIVALNGQWEFYWDQLLTPEDFRTKPMSHLDSFIKVPGSWHDREVASKVYPHQGVATYRLRLACPPGLKDPALRIQRVSAAFKLYANGQLIKEVGNVSKDPSVFKSGYEQVIVGLPNDKQELELIIQVANLSYARGGFRESPIFGSLQSLEQQRTTLLMLQILFIGGVVTVGFYYFLKFLLERKNKTALLFSLLCFINVVHSSLWGETPLILLFPDMPLPTAVRILYFTGYNLVPVMILFALSMYPFDYRRMTAAVILLPNLIFEVLLLAPLKIMASMNTYIFTLQFVQMIYIMGILIKVILRRRDNAVLMFMAIGVFILTLLLDLSGSLGLDRLNLSYLTLAGNFTVITAMSYVQAKQQADNRQKLILYNESLIERDRLKDKIMATEMSFLQAQIKPHFLYNALNAIANVCEKDGKRAGGLIIDLAIYLRGCLGFNNLEKMTTIEKELEFVETYFNIEQARFGQKILLQKKIEAALDYQIPVLILQPLVENAVRHGISKKPEGGTVYLDIKQTEEGIHIEIKDDGVGISTEKLAMLLNEEKKDPGIGLLNIQHRLLRLFGRGLEFKSEIGGGTLVRLIIPEGRQQL